MRTFVPVMMSVFISIAPPCGRYFYRFLEEIRGRVGKPACHLIFALRGASVRLLPAGGNVIFRQTVFRRRGAFVFLLLYRYGR